METQALSKSTQKLWVHGHRGSRGTHPENTLPAFKEAVEAGADVLEMDLQLSSDDVVMVSHEPDITGKLCRDEKREIVKTPIPLRKLTAVQISRYDCGSNAQPNFPQQIQIPGSRIPTLESVLQWVAKEAPGVWLNIETKMTASSPELIPDPNFFAKRVIALVQKYAVVDRVILQSFDFRTLTAAKALEPKLRLACLFESEKDFCEKTLAVGAAYASPFHELVTGKNLSECHRHGIQVVPWTVNEEKDWRRLIELGIDAIITDYPRKLVAFLVKVAK